jgi:hypothetical protein
MQGCSRCTVKIFLFASLIFSAAFLIAQSENIEQVGKSPVEAKLAPGGKIRMDLCPGGVEITGHDEHTLRVSYDASNGHDDVRVRIQVMGDHADLRVTGCPHNNFRLTIEVPQSANLHVRMFAGEMTVNGVAGNKDVELHFGELNLNIGDSADYGHVDASVLSGDLEARPFDVSKGGLFRSFEWTGPGKYRVHAHVGAGEIDLR